MPELGIARNGSVIIREIKRNEYLKSFAKVSEKGTFYGGGGGG